MATKAKKRKEIQVIEVRSSELAMLREALCWHAARSFGMRSAIRSFANKVGMCDVVRLVDAMSAKSLELGTTSSLQFGETMSDERKHMVQEVLQEAESECPPPDRGAALPANGGHQSGSPVGAERRHLGDGVHGHAATLPGEREQGKSGA